MKLLLDENLPTHLKNDFFEFEVFTIRDMGWLGKENGELLKLMIAAGFEVFITGDKNLKNQQNFNRYPIPVIVLNSKRITYADIKPLVSRVKEVLKKPLSPGALIISS